MIEPILKEISEEEYYKHTKEDVWDWDSPYIKRACYDGQGIFYFINNPEPIGYKYYKIVGYKHIIVVPSSIYNALKNIIER